MAQSVLEIIRGKVRKFHKTKSDARKWDIWDGIESRKKPIIQYGVGIDDSSYFYFVHSYLIEAENKTMW